MLNIGLARAVTEGRAGEWGFSRGAAAGIIIGAVMFGLLAGVATGCAVIRCYTIYITINSGGARSLRGTLQLSSKQGMECVLMTLGTHMCIAPAEFGCENCLRLKRMLARCSEHLHGLSNGGGAAGWIRANIGNMHRP